MSRQHPWPHAMGNIILISITVSLRYEVIVRTYWMTHVLLLCMYDTVVELGFDPFPTSFIFPMKNVTILGVFSRHAQKGNGKVLEMKSTYILNIIALLFFLN